MANVVEITVHKSTNPRKVQAKISVSRNELTVGHVLKEGGTALGIRKPAVVFLDNGQACEDKHLEGITNVDDVHLHISDGSTLQNPSRDILHLCMLGSGAVGKSALTLHYIQGQFVPDYDPTIEDAYRKPVEIDGTTVMLDILDTAGQEDFVALRTTWMRGRDGFVLVFSIVDKTSKDDLESFYQQLCDVYDDNLPPFILVGNKVDLDPKFKYYQSTGQGDLNYKREVSTEEGLALGKKWGASRYIETSAKIGYKVSDIFGHLVRDILSADYVKQEKAKAQEDKPKKKFFGGCSLL